MINLSSDAVAGIAPSVLDALARANPGAASAYGADAWTGLATEQLEKVFETPLAAFLIGNGTAANGLALAHITPPWGAVLAHVGAHVTAMECNAPEFFSGGAKVIGLAGQDGKIDPEVLRNWLANSRSGPPGRPRPIVVSLTQCTDLGAVYSAREVAEICEIAHGAGLLVHMDGARLAPAISAASVSPAAMTWRAGIDVLSLGSSKGGTMNAEAVIFFDRDRAAGFDLRMRQAGHTVAKGRYLGAQILAWLEDGRWLTMASHANRMAAKLGVLLSARGAELHRPVAANMVFATLPKQLAEDLAQRGVHYAGPRDRARFVTSWATTEEELDAI